MKAIILAGGMGRRLHPITHEIPKPLIPVKKRPILSHIINFLKRNEVTEFGIIISKNHKDDFESWGKSQKELSIHIELFLEEKSAGTFGCLRLIKKWVGSDDFIVLNGDSLIDFDLKSLIEFHKNNNGIVTACILQNDSIGNYIIPTIKNKLIMDLKRRIVKPKSDFICSGFYVVKSDIFVYDNLNQEMLLMEKDIFPKLIIDRVLIGRVLNNTRFYDCGTMKSWEQAIKEW